MESKGFTLVETSLALVIIGMISMVVFPTLATLHKSMQISVTRNNMQNLLKITAAYAQSQGCLPCPSPPNVGGSKLGKIGGLDNPTGCGVCGTPEGIPPYVSLGIPMALAKDGWGHWLTMRIDPKLAENSPKIVPPTAPCTNADVSSGVCATLGASQKGICKGGLSVANLHPIVQPQAGAPQAAAVVLLSHGANGYGAFIASPLTPATPTIKRIKVSDTTTPSCAEGPESCNASYTRYFLDAEQGETYDDHLLYLDRNALIASTGQGACQTAW